MTKLKSRQRGVGLLEPLIAIAILSFGILGLARFQLNMLGQSSDSKARLNATMFAEELFTQVVVDPANSGCYATVTSGCGYAPAAQAYTDWAARVVAAMPGTTAVPPTVNSELNQPSSNQMRVRITWTSKGSVDTHTYEAITDVRP
jgi:Tfp pilus assembly protein PilV